MSRKESFREVFLGIEKVDGKEKLSKAGVLRLSKTLFLASWIGLNAVRMSLSNSVHLAQDPVYLTGIISTFMLTHGYHKSKDSVLEVVKQNDYLLEED